ncbi:uncharacterized protein EDB91DRAFT_1085862 [Suillus paluster]|uniref:uncharacterized protein n=1 Tax=Suillus paluster TaxID=48578 RepID=UPI001B88364C|nr:uncharacterized protein EDB91DRAFT_1085862 [Suillus paluster]KAG1729081.1 hypothetical protein EDB91DRAFT_1085862 [Suillus paluster]
MRLSVTLAYITLAAAATVRPATSSSVEENTCSSDKSVIEERKGWGVAAKSLFDKPSELADTLNVHTWWNGLQNTAESFWDKVVEIGPNIQQYTDELLHHAMELYPSEKIMEFKESVDNVTSTATALHQVVFAAAKQSGRPLDVSILEELQGVFSVVFEELRELFLPPEEAPGHENRTVMISMVLDHIEEIFLQVAIMHGGKEELLAAYSSPLKFAVQHISVTIGVQLGGV